MSKKTKASTTVESPKSPLKLSLDTLPTINRFVLVVEPTNKFLEWARKLPDEGPTLTLDELLEDASAYLIPHMDSDLDSWLALEQVEGCKPMLCKIGDKKALAY